jgi:hypothetical protein
MDPGTLPDPQTLTRHILQSALLVGTAAPTLWAGQRIWQGGQEDTEQRRAIFRAVGALFIAVAPQILIQYISPEESESAGIFCLFVAVLWLALALPALEFLRKLFGPRPRI